MTVGASFLAKIKLAAGLTASTYDTDITDEIESARAELIRVGVDPSVAISETDALARRAVKTFVQSNYAENEGEAKRLADSFASQAAALSQSTGYRADNDEVVEDEV